MKCSSYKAEEREREREADSQPARFNTDVVVDTTPMPDHIPKVKEIGATSAPLLSAAYFIGARCRSYNDDYMQCKTESYGRGELDCMKEGRKVTRCAASVLVVFPIFCGRSYWKGGRQVETDIALQTGSMISTRTVWKNSERIGVVWKTTTTNYTNVEDLNEY